MKILLATLNAKYIHSSLALAYLKAYCSKACRDIEIREYTINERIDNIVASIFSINPQIICFSCYIWNIQMIREICGDYKKISPSTIIILGGPEVSYNSREILEADPFIDYIVRGEGEQTLEELLEAIQNGGAIEEVKGITYREPERISETREREEIINLDEIPSPFDRDSFNYQNKIIYYETARGCPFNCSYCLSCATKSLRFFSIDRVKQDLAFLIKQEPKTIKFVDRTFNCNEKRAREIMEFIIQNRGKTKIHLEICAELLSDAMLEFLKDVPPGIFDFEIGVQSTNSETLKAVNRASNWAKLSKNILVLKEKSNIHLHLDLIAGLPFESLDRFASSFNDVYSLEPDVIQMGFLKILNGSTIKKQTEIFSYEYQDHPPYRILSNQWLNFGEVVKLIQVEEILNRYYNTGIVRNTLNYIIDSIYNQAPFSFYNEFSTYWEANNLYSFGHKRDEEYSFLKRFIDSCHPKSASQVNEIIKYDYLLNNLSYDLPPGICSWEPDLAHKVLNALIKEPDFIMQHLNHLSEKSIREIKKQVHLEFFSFDPVQKVNCFDELIPILFIYDPVKKKAVKTINILEQNISGSS